MCHQNRAWSVQNSLATELIPQSRDISPKSHRSRVETVNLPIQKSLGVLEDKFQLHIWVLRDDFYDLGLDTGQI